MTTTEFAVPIAPNFIVSCCFLWAHIVKHYPIRVNLAPSALFFDPEKQNLQFELQRITTVSNEVSLTDHSQSLVLTVVAQTFLTCLYK